MENCGELALAQEKMANTKEAPCFFSADFLNHIALCGHFFVCFVIYYHPIVLWVLFVFSFFFF